MSVRRAFLLKIPVLGRVLAQRDAANAALSEAVRQREIAEAARWAEVKQREAAEAERWAAIEQRDIALAERAEAIRQRDEAEVARGEAVTQREAAEAQFVAAVRQREEAEAALSRPAVRAGLSPSAHDPALSTQALRWEDRPDLEKQGLFVVGHARSGTTILLRALNMSPDIYLLGEANVHVEGLKSGFARWYNEMHRADGQPRDKFTYCPRVPHDDANGVETLDWLSRRFRYVGEKVAFRSEKLGYDPQNFFEFHARHFFTSHYLCVLRNPLDTLKSNREMFRPDDLSIYSESYLRTCELILDLYYTLPNVLVLFHELVNQETFDRIGERLGIDLGGLDQAYYKPRQVIGHHGSGERGLPAIKILKEAYRQMRAAFSPQTLREIPLHPEWQTLGNSIRAMREEIAG